jgi:hypothetical protein
MVRPLFIWPVWTVTVPPDACGNLPVRHKTLAYLDDVFDEEGHHTRSRRRSSIPATSARDIAPFKISL